MKRPKKTKFKLIKSEVFPYDVMVAYETTIEEIKGKLKKYGIELSKEDEEFLSSKGLAHTLKLQNNAVFIYFRKTPTHGVIAHEAFHATLMVLATMGAELSLQSEEIYAYMIEYLVNQIEDYEN